MIRKLDSESSLDDTGTSNKRVKICKSRRNAIKPAIRKLIDSVEAECLLTGEIAPEAAIETIHVLFVVYD